jgi:UPF0755 protein
MRKYSVHNESSKLPWIVGLVIFVIVAALVTSVVVIRRNYYANLEPVGTSQRNQLVVVQKGDTARDIAATLKKAGVIRQTWAFEWYVRNHDLRDKLQAGTYYIRPSQSVAEIAKILTQGQVATDLVTILPGQRLDQIQQALVNAGFKPDDVQASLNPELYKNHPALVDKPVSASLEGYLYPDSFQRHPDTSARVIITASLDEMQKRLTPDIRAGFVKQGLTVHQGVILASIVEQEVGKQSDRPIVAQVFLSRIHQGMQLGSDVTAFYGAIINDQKPSVAYDSPYNTRIHSGMPPGPISNVSQTSLQAIANPAATDYLYFVAGDDGNTYFSKTLQEHEALTAQHCKKLCAPE